MNVIELHTRDSCPAPHTSTTRKVEDDAPDITPWSRRSPSVPAIRLPASGRVDSGRDSISAAAARLLNDPRIPDRNLVGVAR